MVESWRSDCLCATEITGQSITCCGCWPAGCLPVRVGVDAAACCILYSRLPYSGSVCLPYSTFFLKTLDFCFPFQENKIITNFNSV